MAIIAMLSPHPLHSQHCMVECSGVRMLLRSNLTLFTSSGPRVSWDLRHPASVLPPGVQGEPHSVAARPGCHGTLQASAMFARESWTSLHLQTVLRAAGPTGAGPSIAAAPLRGRLHTEPEEIKNWGGAEIQK